jgi:D-serine deaminase-like pyridoxal phosphate-dependent protein
MARSERLRDLPTPCLVLEQGRMQRNIARMADRSRALGVQLRPHLKTCKSAEIASRLAPDRARITVSTLLEAEYFADAGFSDILYAVGIVPSKLPQVSALNARGARVQVILDSPKAAKSLQDTAVALNTHFEAWIEIDVDGHRAGLEPDDPQVVEAAQVLQQSERTALVGVMTHAGESYNCRSVAELETHAERERRRCVRAAERIRTAGLDCTEVSVGSTPTALSARSLDGVTELRAGVYVFFDLFQAGLGVCDLDDIALSVLTTVISHKASHRRLIVDAGGLALSKDRSTADQALDCGYGLVTRADDSAILTGLKVSGANQEHGMIELLQGLAFEDFPVGSQLRILPNHACMTAAAHDRYHVVEGDDRVVDCWTRCNGW